MKTFSQLSEELKSCCPECRDDSMYGSVEEDFMFTGDEQYEDWGDLSEEVEHDGKKVHLNKPFRTSDGKGKFAVYTKNDKGNVVKVNFGDTTGLTIKTGNPERRHSYRARHHCETPGPKWKANYWSCRSWSKGSVSAGLGV
jgi:hypothetical protein